MINRQIEDFTSQSILDLGIQYLSGPVQIANARKRGKKIVAGFLPPMELVFAAKNTLPLFLPRLTEFPFSQYIGIVNIINRLHLLKYVLSYYSKNQDRVSMSYFDSFNQSEFSKIFTSLIHLAEKAEFYMDTCVQTRICYGALVKNFHLIDLVAGGLEGDYCLHFAKFYERMTNFKPVFYFEKPYGDRSNKALVDVITEELHRYIATLENLSGATITEPGLLKIANITNEIRGYMRELYGYYIKGYVPLHTAALLLVHGSYVDFLSDAPFFLNKMRNLVQEIRRKYRKGLPNYRKEGVYRVLIAGSPGFDPILPSTFEKAGAVLQYLDLFESCTRYKGIKTTVNMIENYANYLLDLNIKEGIMDLIDIWLAAAKKIKADAILFSNVWGCRFTTPAYRKMKDLVNAELGIPIYPLDFYSPGDSLGQVQTRIGAFIEMLK
ncbi:MAG: 2-hydroxyacyl-CoA dehydratase family protein [Candidatus Helarchaeota archaeon]|nr:2-hydroxyacyl-CoA dehydratase family protein [Candidatus Helarchaeota archaeon]